MPVPNGVRLSPSNAHARTLARVRNKAKRHAWKTLAQSTSIADLLIPPAMHITRPQPIPITVDKERITITASIALKSKTNRA